MPNIKLITQTMQAPEKYDGAKAPFVNAEQLQKAQALAQEKLAYLLKSANPENTRDPNSFLDLRDGGVDTAGKPGMPVMTGWINYPDYLLNSSQLISGLQKAAQAIVKDHKAWLSVGIGGSYTNVEGVIRAIKRKQTDLPLYFLGQHLSANSYQQTFDELNALNGSVAVNIISKSGTTTEPAIAMRLVEERLKNRGATFATTDPAKGALRKMIPLKNYNLEKYLSAELQKEFFIGEDIGGRFSVLTPVGLLPMAVAGVDIKKLVEGAAYAQKNLLSLAVEYAAARYAAYQNGAVTEVKSYNQEELRMLILGLRQLQPESDGKNSSGVNVMEEFYTADAHSNGQLIKSGVRNVMETFHFVEKTAADYDVPASQYGDDGLGVIESGAAGALKLNRINNYFMAGLWLDHWQSGVPSMAWVFPETVDEYTVGQFLQIHFVATVLFGLMIGVNPVNQPGVQGYKNIAFELLGMKGKEEQEKKLKTLKALGLEI
jgi:glucose-6-phosphate isomerase